MVSCCFRIFARLEVCESHDVLEPREFGIDSEEIPWTILSTPFSQTNSRLWSTFDQLSFVLSMKN